MSVAASDALRQLRDRPMVFVDDLDQPVLDDADRRHLERSLRLRPGSPITVSDGRGRWRPARFGPAPEPDGEIVDEGQPAVTLRIGFAPVKGDRSDLVVQKLTELGIDVVVPLVTERSVVRWDEQRAARNRDRHRRIAREAAMQSRNPRLPTIEPLTSLAGFCADPAVVLADPAGPRLDAAPLDAADPPPTAVAIGPEGGFTADELAGRRSGGLPGRILRTETAAITAGVLLVSNHR